MAKRAKGVKGYSVKGAAEGKRPVGRPRKPRPEAEAGTETAEAHGSGGTFIAIKRSEFERLHSRCKAAERVIADERGSLGGLISDATENHHLHAKSYGMFKRLDKMEPAKRAEILFHFRLYCSWADWDESDLFSDRLPQTSAELEQAFDQAKAAQVPEAALPGLTGAALDEHLKRVENGGSADPNPF